MDQINRFSSRRGRLDRVFLADRLRGARSYKRIAGYFRSSIFELVGEEVWDIPLIQILCNSELDAVDIKIAQKIKEVWNQDDTALQGFLHRERYQTLYELLRSGRLEVRVVPKDVVFVHGKAGVIELETGEKTAFLGSANETRSGFASNYEIVWEDTSEAGVAWVEEEFDALWSEGHPLSEAIIADIQRIAARVEISFPQLEGADDIPGAIFAESPIYRGGDQLQVWQRMFVAKFLEHREAYGKVRLLLADEVGVGKTLSLAASAIVAALLDDGPVLIFCPASLVEQWQTELWDRLGVPSGRWSREKTWIDHDGRAVGRCGVEAITRCPFQIGIISTGLIVSGSSGERERLLEQGGRYGTVILDEAHRAGKNREDEPGNLMAFMLKIATKTRHILLGTATPIQTEVGQLWELLEILNEDAGFVLGQTPYSMWSRCEDALALIKGETEVLSEKDAWDWIRNPLPSAKTGTPGLNRIVSLARKELTINDGIFWSDRGYGSLAPICKNYLRGAMVDGFFMANNPVSRHVVLRRRRDLEEDGLLPRIGAVIHPEPGTFYANLAMHGTGLMTNAHFELAYGAAVDFTTELAKRVKAAGFLKSLMLQRICSSFAAGTATARKILARGEIDASGDDEEEQEVATPVTAEERVFLERIIENLSRAEQDPKLEAVLYFLTKYPTEGKTWLEHGCIVFSQYYETANWLASQLSLRLKGEPIGVYAGAGKSHVRKDGVGVAADREDIKRAVKAGEIRLIVATEAAGEGLNLQTLGTLINVDLPWNPARLEQRLGRIRRIGQARKEVDVANLVYSDTQDEKVYNVLSRRMKDRFDIFASIPDTIEDGWILGEEELSKQMDVCMDKRREMQKRTGNTIKAQAEFDDTDERWELCSQVLARRDVVSKLSQPW